MTCYYKKVCGMQWHLRKENEVVRSYRWQFQDGRSKGMGTEWDKEVVGINRTIPHMHVCTDSFMWGHI